MAVNQLSLCLRQTHRVFNESGRQINTFVSLNSPPKWYHMMKNRLYSHMCMHLLDGVVERGRESEREREREREGGGGGGEGEREL